MATIYKLTDQKMRTHNGFQWTLGEWQETSGDGELCGPGWLHAYSHPLIALLHNPMHANINNPRLFEGEADGTSRDDRGLKCGYTRMRLTAELPLPSITTEQRVRYAIGCALSVYKEPYFVRWAQGWLDGTDRTWASAAVVAAANASNASNAAWAAAAAARSKAMAANATANAAVSAAVVAAVAKWAAARDGINLIAIAEWAIYKPWSQP